MIALNGNMLTADALREHGLTPRYATIWLGSWSRIENGRSPDLANEMRRAKSRGLGVHIQFFFWGDSLTSDALRAGSAESTSGRGAKTMAEYVALRDAIGRTLRDAPSVPALVNVETEWNKGGVRNDPEPFDRLFRDTAVSIKGRAPHAKIVSAPGGWEHSNLDALMPRFPRVLANADVHATQALFAHGRHDRATYLRGPDILMDALRRLRSVIPDGAVLMVTDFAFSSHKSSESRHPFAGDARGFEDEQRMVLEKMRNHLPEMRALGVTDIFARSVKDVDMALHNYFGYAERAWGVVTQDNQKKAGYDAFIAIGSTASKPAISAEDVVFRVTAANEGWAQVRMGPRRDVASAVVLVMDDGAGSAPMRYREDWQEWTIGTRIPAGTEVRFVATVDGNDVRSPLYIWPNQEPASTPGDVREQEPAPEPEPEPEPAPTCKEVLAEVRATLETPEGEYVTKHARNIMQEKTALKEHAEAMENALAEEIEKHGATRAALDKAREAISAAIADLEEAYTEAGGGA